VTRNGIEWRALPADLPPWDSVYAFYERWNRRGLPQRLAGRLRGHQGREREPTACIINSQIVKCADTVGAKTSGYHGGKKIKGRGRHLIVILDTEGWLLALVVTAASVSDKAGARLAAARLIALFTTLQLMWADSGYDGKPLRDWKNRRHHARNRQENQHAHIPGRETPLDRRAHFRMAHALPATRP
jgi:transposase